MLFSADLILDQSICGISVVDDSFERLKRFNLEELFENNVRSDVRKALKPTEDGDTEAGGEQPPPGPMMDTT
jgi:hypothetical protein